MAIHLHVQFRIMSVRIVPGKTTTNSSFASRQQKSISSLMSFRQDRSSFTCNRQMKLHTPISRCHCALPHLTECVVLTDHYKHGTLRPAGASDAADSLQLLPAYIRGLPQNLDGFIEKFLLSVFDELRNCSLASIIYVRLDSDCCGFPILVSFFGDSFIIPERKEKMAWQFLTPGQKLEDQRRCQGNS